MLDRSRRADAGFAIVDARWTPQVNLHVLACRCGARHEHRADRSRVRCPGCGAVADLHAIREALAPGPGASLLTAALSYAARGWSVFPLVPGEKRPAVTDWEARATTDAHRIRRAWHAGNYGIGIACGPSGLVVLDLDVPKPDSPPLPADLQAEGATEGLDVLAVLADRAGQTFPAGTYAARTGRGGTHLYFTHPGGPELQHPGQPRRARPAD